MNEHKPPPNFSLTPEQLEAFKKQLKAQKAQEPKPPDQRPLHNIKDSVFTRLFQESDNQIALYCALHPNEKPPTVNDIVLVTLQSIVSTHTYNDLGLLVRGRVLILVEAQSKWSLNIVLRSLVYLINTWKELLTCTNDNVYGTKPVTLPAFESYVIFTGHRKKQPEWLSFKDIYPMTGESLLDFRVRCIYKKEGGTDIIQQYIEFACIWDAQSRRFDKAHQMDALRKTIDICLKRGILAKFFIKRRAEIMDLATLLFDQDEVTRRTMIEHERRGEKRGEKRGERKGGKQKALEIAKSMKAMHLDTETIVQCTGLPQEQIDKL